MLRIDGSGRRLTACGIGLLLGLASCAPGGGLAAPAPLSADELVRAAALMEMEDSRTTSIQSVLAASSAESSAIRARSALTLGRLRSSEGRDALVSLLQDPDTAVAATAAFSLGQLGDTLVVPNLAAVMNGSGALRWTVAAEAASALGKLGSAASADALMGLLATQELGARAREPVASALLATWRHPRPTDYGFITRWTASPDPELRWRAAYALVRRPTAAAASVLQPLVTDPDARVRAMALRSLTAPLADSAGIGTDALPAVIAAINDPDYTVRINAARTLGTYSAPTSVQALTGALEGSDGHLAITAAESLGRLSTAASMGAQRLGEVALDATRSVALRQTALEALARIQPSQSAEIADRLAFDPAWRIRASAARALALAPPSARDRLATLRRDADGRVASAALQALVAAAGDSVAPLRSVLIESLAMPDIGARTAAISALGRLGDPATLPMLLDAYGRALADDDNDAQLAAIDAIAALERAGASPARAFFTRFRRSDDYMVRLRAQSRFGGAANSWGDPLPLEPRHAAYADMLAAAQPPNPRPRVLIETNVGSIDLRLFARDATLTVENFVRLARSGYFDGQEWPRVVPNFVVQGGDPRGDTSGGPGYSIRDEFNRHRYGTGTLGMALSGPDTGGSQWFITHSPQPHLDGAYTVFGEMVSGQDVLERIVPGDRILRINVLP